MECGAGGFAVRRVDEHQVDVGAVIEFLAAQLSERDHGKRAGLPPAFSIFATGFPVARGQLVADLPVGEIENGVRQVGEFTGDIGQRCEAQDIAQQDAQSLAAPETRQQHG